MIVKKVTAKRKLKKRDPNAPKRPLSAYMEVAKVERSKILADAGPLSLVETGRELGRRWRNLDTSQKAAFEEKSIINKKTYEDAVKLTSMPLDESSIETCQSGSNLPESESEVQSVDVQQSSTNSKNIVLDDIGFAKEKRFPWFPALKSGSSAKGNRVYITYFGSGDKAIVNKSNWLPFSEQTLAKMFKKKSSDSSAFKFGMKQLNAVREKLLNDNPVSVSSIGSNTRLQKRRFQQLSKDRLQEEEEENTRHLELKMHFDEDRNVWKCKDCSWTGKFKNKAKAHTRYCGARRKIKKSVNRSFICSGPNCQQEFSSKKHLKEHYRYLIRKGLKKIENHQ